VFIVNLVLPEESSAILWCSVKFQALQKQVG